MTAFQKWVLILLTIFGLVYLYFWRSDVKYERAGKEAGMLKRLDKYFK